MASVQDGPDQSSASIEAAMEERGSDDEAAAPAEGESCAAGEGRAAAASG